MGVFVLAKHCENPSIPTASGSPGMGQLSLLRVRKNAKVPHFKRFLTHLSAPSFLRPVYFPAAACYPVGKGSAAIRRSMLPNSRRVRWLSANRVGAKRAARSTSSECSNKRIISGRATIEKDCPSPLLQDSERSVL